MIAQQALQHPMTNAMAWIKIVTESLMMAM